MQRGSDSGIRLIEDLFSPSFFIIKKETQEISQNSLKGSRGHYPYHEIYAQMGQQRISLPTRRKRIVVEMLLKRIKR